MFRFFRKLRRKSGSGQPPAAERPRRQLDPSDPLVETIDEWFVRTTRMLLRQARRGADADGKRMSPHEQRIDALEKANAALKADKERLSSEVVALRTLLYGRDRED